MNPQTDWLSAVIILAAGLILGLLFLFLSRSKKKIVADAGPLAELEAKRDALIEELRGLDLDGERRAELELQTARVLREIDEAAEVPAEPVVAGSFFASAMKGFAWGALTFAVLGGMGYMVMSKAGPRETAAMASPAPVPASAPAPAPDFAIEELTRRIAAEPQNHQLRNDLAQKELERDNLMAVFEQTKLVLAEHPDDSRALTLQAMVRAAMGEGERAMEMLGRATKSDPKNLDARVALAWVYARNGRMSDAEATIAAAIKVAPSEKPLLEKILSQIKTQVTKR